MMEIAAGDIRRLDLESILASASDITGLDDMGEPDILPGLRLVIDGLIREAHLAPRGVEAQRATLINLVANRCRIADTFRRHPEIHQEKIRAPIVITGLARSGTTKMQRLMAVDPALQKLPLWRILNPMPLGRDSPDMTPGGEDPRIAMTEQLSAMMRDHYPHFYAGHPMNAREPDEEMLMADLVMRGSFVSHALRLPSFDKWLREQNHGSWYEFLFRMLQLFQWQDGSPQKRWLLKAPAHLGYLGELFKVFPDATLVTCHRDPVATTASMARLSSFARQMYSDFADDEELGRFELASWGCHMKRYVEQRPRYELKHRFVDVAYADITGNTMAAIERIYAVAEMPLPAETREAMQAWEAANPPGKHGRHSYDLEGSGLSVADVHCEYAPYLERFGHLI